VKSAAVAVDRVASADASSSPWRDVADAGLFTEGLRWRIRGLLPSMFCVRADVSSWPWRDVADALLSSHVGNAAARLSRVVAG
jgi:hypothetical protein